MSYCDGEICGTCGQVTILGNDANDECSACSTDGSLGKLLALMAAGVSRDVHSGRFVTINQKG